jgi:magnesium transporter
MPNHHESFLVDENGTHATVDRDMVREHLDRAQFFWLDLHRPSADQLALLREPFGLHPLAVEDTEHFGQRPKLEEFDGYVYLVAYGANADRDGLVEVHCFVSEKYLVTVHRDDCPAFEDLRRQVVEGRPPALQPALALYRVVDALVDSFFPELARLDDRIDELENGVLQKPDDAQLQEVFRLKRRLVAWRKAITPQRDLFARMFSGVVEIPGMTPDTERYYRDIYDHLIRISDLVDSYRDLLTGAMDVYLSTVSNRLNEVMKRLTIVATIFMPLTWVVGFFGMNFAWMVRAVNGWVPFILLGVVTQIAILAVMLVLFRRRRWI